MNPGRKQEQGFTLIEVLAAIVILSVVSLVLTSYFTNAMTYSKSNQNKTIMVNLARNALFYIEKQDFEKMEQYFNNPVTVHDTITADKCQVDENDILSCDAYQSLVKDQKVFSQILNPYVNGVNYKIEILYQRETHNTLLKSTDLSKKAMAKYLIPVSIKVSAANQSEGPKSESVVEGYISDEKIR